jgi:regulator of sirC expression with transglutaminase-like and TPR domain
MDDPIDRMTFASELRAPGGPGLARANLLIAREVAYPDLRPSRYLTQLDAWAAEASGQCARTASVAERAACVSQLLFGELDLRGNEEAYYDPRNSYLNEVMERRLGLPISLSAIYLEVAERIGLPAYGVGLPGHFVVAVADGEVRHLLDPFHGGAPLTREDAAALVRSVTGYSGPFLSGWLSPVSTPQILARMLQNLRGAYVRQEAWGAAAAIVERLRLLQPQAPEHLRELGVLLQRAGALRRAAEYLEEYLLLAPDAPDAESVRQTLNAMIRQLARLN